MEAPFLIGGTQMDGAAGSAGSRLSWEQAHRLEVTLRARASRLNGSLGPGCCPGCGRPVSPSENQLRLAGLTVHSDCLCEDAAV
jgi:hypothetical protein